MKTSHLFIKNWVTCPPESQQGTYHPCPAEYCQPVITKIISDKNAVARNQNIHYCARSDQVLPLVNPLTCAPIPNFPTTINDIFRMNEQQTDSLMEQLNLQTGEGTSLAGKKAQIKMYIGVRSHVDKPAT